MYNCRILTWEEIASVYDSYMKHDFPSDELKPLSMIKKSLDKDEYFCYGIFSGDKLCGYACFVSLIIDEKQYCLLDYFATVSGLRGKGVGSEFLHLLRNKLKNAEMVICESEDPMGTSEEEFDIRHRRIAFYLRNHFVETGVTAEIFSVNYVLLELDTGQKHTETETRDHYARMYRSFLPEKLYSRFVKIN
ncbi:MAG: GNAT family N-acetyltransferase [Ruminococcus flavefaciens]